MGTLAGPGSFTVFAPTDEAFSGVPNKYSEATWSNHLADILTYHVLDSKVYSSDLSVGLTATALNGGDVEVTSIDPPMINDASVTSADLNAVNGVVHIIDTVLLPTSATTDIVDLASGIDTFST